MQIGVAVIALIVSAIMMAVAVYAINKVSAGQLMKDTVTWVCLYYAAISFFAFWGISIYQVLASKVANDTVSTTVAAKREARSDFSDAGEVLEKGAKLVEALTKAGPAIASLGASVVALGFASYIVAQSPKDQDKPAGGPGPTTQPAPKTGTSTQGG
jgi:hypothetical protein